MISSNVSCTFRLSCRSVFFACRYFSTVTAWSRCASKSRFNRPSYPASFSRRRRCCPFEASASAASMRSSSTKSQVAQSSGIANRRIVSAICLVISSSRRYGWAHSLTPLDEWFVLQQVDFVGRPYVVTEHRARKYQDPRTGRIVIAPLPVASRRPDRRVRSSRRWPPARKAIVICRAARSSGSGTTCWGSRSAARRWSTSCRSLGRLRRALCPASRGPGLGTVRRLG